MKFVVLLIVGGWLTLCAISLALTLRLLVMLCVAAVLEWREQRRGHVRGVARRPNSCPDEEPAS
ncbi:MAG TPA: hypothetical protein VNL18_03080 [Gemmatimonadales bacterium]|nr:hypothetical protein [Gemmatimonadales bacterium]